MEGRRSGLPGRKLSDTDFADMLKPLSVKFIERFYCRKFRSFDALFLRRVLSVIKLGFHQFQQEIRIALVWLKLLNYLRIFVERRQPKLLCVQLYQLVRRICFHSDHPLSQESVVWVKLRRTNRYVDASANCCRGYFLACD